MSKSFAGLLACGALLAAPSGAAAAGAGLCELNGTATFPTPLSATDQDFSGYSFHGTLSPCGGTDGASLTATVTAGETYQGFPEPRTTASGSCAHSTTSGTAFVQWSDGTLTIVDYDTAGALAAVALAGTVRPSITLNSSAGSRTFSTTRYRGGYSSGPLAFEPSNPTACEAGGVRTAGIQGLMGLVSG